MFGSVKDVMTQPLNDVVDDLRNEFITATWFTRLRAAAEIEKLRANVEELKRGLLVMRDQHADRSRADGERA